MIYRLTIAKELVPNSPMKPSAFTNLRTDWKPRGRTTLRVSRAIRGVSRSLPKASSVAESFGFISISIHLFIDSLSFKVLTNPREWTHNACWHRAASRAADAACRRDYTVFIGRDRRRVVHVVGMSYIDIYMHTNEHTRETYIPLKQTNIHTYIHTDIQTWKQKHTLSSVKYINMYVHLTNARRPSWQRCRSDNDSSYEKTKAGCMDGNSSTRFIDRSSFLLAIT